MTSYMGYTLILELQKQQYDAIMQDFLPTPSCYIVKRNKVLSSFFPPTKSTPFFAL